MSELTPEQVQQVNFNLGPWVSDFSTDRPLIMTLSALQLIGSCLDLLLQGVLLSQFVNYYTWYTDERGLRIAVAGLAVLTILKSVQSFAVKWIMFIPYFGDLHGAILLNYTTWWQAGNPLMAIFRCCGPHSTTPPPTTSRGQRTALSKFGSLSIYGTVFVGDVVLSFSTAFLLKSKQNVLPHTLNLINALIRLNFQTAAPAALWPSACFNLIFSQVTVTSGASLVSTAFNMPLPKLYAISMMWTLNARQTFSANQSDSMTYTTIEFSAGQSLVQRRSNGDLELGTTAALEQRGRQFDIRRTFFNLESKCEADTRESNHESTRSTK
ncbi:hypothetical protein C8R47DRAFT_1293753 [Mycena vitilis]|nr:hypothetical protein C8R47DRAFT_1293753 [Mycena vitilis]